MNTAAWRLFVWGPICDSARSLRLAWRNAVFILRGGMRPGSTLRPRRTAK
jgi:hypothetical protein